MGKIQKEGAGARQQEGVGKIHKKGVGKIQKEGAGEIQKEGIGKVHTKKGVGKIQKEGAGEILKEGVGVTPKEEEGSGLGKGMWGFSYSTTPQIARCAHKSQDASPDHTPCRRHGTTGEQKEWSWHYNWALLSLQGVHI